MHATRFAALGTIAAVTLLAACGKKGEEQAPAGATTQAAAPTPAPAAAGGPAWSSTPLTPTGKGKVVVVNAMTDEKGVNRFDPNEVEVHQGDVLRFTLKAGVHNVHFVADSNPGKSGFPTAPTDMLQLPGQTYEVLVNWAPGTYYFQCDPHALLGMKGHVKVEKED